MSRFRLQPACRQWLPPSSLPQKCAVTMAAPLNVIRKSNSPGTLNLKQLIRRVSDRTHAPKKQKKPVAESYRQLIFIHDYQPLIRRMFLHQFAVRGLQTGVGRVLLVLHPVAFAEVFEAFLQQRSVVHKNITVRAVDKPKPLAVSIY